MLILVFAAVGVVTLITGIRALRRGEIRLSRSKTLHGRSANIAGGITILLGIAVLISAISLEVLMFRGTR